MRALDRVRAVPVWAVLGGIVLVSAALRIWLGRRMTAPWIFVDELIYSELAKSFAAHGHFLLRGEPAGNAFGFVYPVLIAPAWRLFSSVPEAYAAAKVIGSVAMSLAAVPAYFLARRVLSRPYALAAAALAVAIPSMLYTGTLMTENAFYPLFLCVALATVCMLERPTRGNQVGVLALCLIAYATRQQAIALVPAVLAAPLLLGRHGLGRFRVLYGTVAAAAAVVVVGEAARGNSPLALLGAYETTGHQHYAIPTVAKWLLWHVAELDLYLGVVPVIAFLVAFRREPFFAVAATFSAFLIVEVAAFATLPTVQRIEERNLFYVAPFFLIALLLWIERGAQRPRWTVVATALAAALPATVPYVRFIGTAATADTLALLPWWKLQEHVIALHHVRLAISLAAIAAAALFLAVPRRAVLVLPILVFLYLGAVQRSAESRMTFASHGALFQGIRGVPRDWIDRTVGRDAAVAVLWTGRADVHAVWENELFNRSLGTVYDTDQPIPGGLASTPVTIGRDGYLRAGGRLLRAPYALVDGSVDLNGELTKSDSLLGINLWRLDGPIRSVTRVTGLYRYDTWSGPAVTYRRFGCHGGSVKVTLLSDAGLFPEGQTVRAGGVAHRVEPGVPITITAPLARCAAHFIVSPTRVPGHGDPRRLGIHFVSFAYQGLP
ncbi:MAG TPA: glycosyltransferase family 39 protein [Gaiellaceae bacterium]